jgi:hypothetical protein
MLVDSGTGLSGWRQLEPACAGCAGWSAALTFHAFAERLGGAISVASDCEPCASQGLTERAPAAADRGTNDVAALTAASEPSLTVVAAEVALLQARLDELQRQLAHLSGDDPS